MKSTFETLPMHNAVDKILANIIVICQDSGQEIDYTTIKRIVKSLDQHGFFELRGAVAKASNTFNVSRVTIYSAIKSQA